MMPSWRRVRRSILTGKRPWSGRRAVVTGGLGFIGSNLAIRLHELGAEVTVIDSCVPGCGGRRENLGHLDGAIRVVPLGIETLEDRPDLLESADVVFNLAGEVSHSASMRDPLRDLEYNTSAQLRFLRALAAARPGVRVVYASTRQVCGRPLTLPVHEDHPVNPNDFNGIHKRAAEQYHLLYARLGRLDSIVLRLTNTYGPRLALGVPGQGFLTVFFRRVLDGEPLEVFGDGMQLRDPIYVDDVVEAFLLAGTVPAPPFRLYNICGPDALTLREIARIVQTEAGQAERIVIKPFPEEHRAFDIGSFAGDSTRVRAALGWSPNVDFREGVRRTLAHFLAPVSTR